MRGLLFIAIMIALAVVAFQQVKSTKQTVQAPGGTAAVATLPAQVGADVEAAAAERARKLQEAVEQQQ